MSPGRRSSRGFSLPEVLVAIAVFGVTGAALASVLVLNVSSNRLSDEITQATSYGQDKIEFFRTTAPATNTTGETSGIFTRRWTVANGPSAVAASTKLVTVTVAWRDSGNRSVELKTYVTY
jgi:prepilin-type N-terminal cleavage/methylation domain-containing protein